MDDMETQRTHKFTEYTYRLSEAADILSVHKRTLQRWQRLGKISLIVLPGGDYRMTVSELNRLLAQRAQPRLTTESATPEA